MGGPWTDEISDQVAADPAGFTRTARSRSTQDAFDMSTRLDAQVAETPGSD